MKIDSRPTTIAFKIILQSMFLCRKHFYKLFICRISVEATAIYCLRYRDCKSENLKMHQRETDNM